MKLYSILLFYKNPEDNQALLLKSSYDLLSFSFFHRNQVKEFTEFAGKLSVERSAASSRCTIKEQNYFCHCCVRADNLAGFCVTDDEFQAQPVFYMLTRVMEDFAEIVPEETWPTIQNEQDCTYSNLDELLHKWQNLLKEDLTETDAYVRVQNEVEETKVVLYDTIQAVLERGEKLDDLVKSSQNLSESSKIYYNQARMLNKCCKWV